MEIISKERKLCYFLGDFNLNILNYDSHSATAEFLDTLYAYATLPLINRPTRITQSSATAIDNIFTNDANAFENGCHGILVTDISDHFPVFHIGDSKIKNESMEKSICIRDFSYKNKMSFQRELGDIDWSEMYSQSDTQEAFSVFHKAFVRLYDKHFPGRKVELKYNNRKPWLTSALKESIRRKNNLYYQYRKIKSCYYEGQYKSYRNKLTKLLKCAEKKHYAELLESNKSNLKKTWSILKSIVNKKKTQKIITKFKLSDNTVITDSYNISENFNDFFVNIGHGLAKRIPNTNILPSNFTGDNVSQTIFLQHVTKEEMSNLISSLKNGAPGYDGITAQVLQNSMTPILEPLCFLCNRSLTDGVFPNELKLANVLPLFKSGDDMLFNNYRPVSLLCTLSKVFEKVMYSRLLSFLESQKVLIKNQFGFRRLHSSYMALMLMGDKITKALDNGDYVIGIFLDFSKAFDTVNHEILLDKLSHYGVRGNAYDWFKSYLSNRSQYVTYNGVASSTKNITCGVPQGSILGPLLFLIYINDLYNVCQESVPILFADDTNLFYSAST